MNCRNTIFAAVMILLLVTHASPLNAAWPADGILACGEDGEQVSPHVVSDGAGGMIVAWRDLRTGNEVYAQRLNGAGMAMWTDGGINLSPGITGIILGLVPDDAGGAIVIWGDADIEELKATSIGPDGTLPWGAGGVIIDTSALAYDIVVAEDGSGGALVAWMAGGSYYVQRVVASGTEMWPANGIQYTSIGMESGYEPDLISDGAGGALIAYMDDDFSTPDIYVQRIYANGSSWSISGTQVDYTTGLSQASYHPAVTLDGAGGAYVAWQRNDSGTVIVAQKIDPLGNRVFVSSIQVCSAAGSQEKPDIISDGVGGAVIIWEREMYSSLDIYAQRLDAYGIPLWESCGMPVCEASYDQYDAALISVSEEDFMAGWTGEPVGGPGAGNPISVQKIDLGGVVRWAPGGVQLIEGDVSTGFSLVADGSGGVMAVVAEDRSLGTARDIYAQSFNSFGVPSAPEPSMTAVDDVPGDQGGWLRLTIGASDRDRIEQDSEQVTFYDVWQRIDDPPALSALTVVPGGGCIAGLSPGEEDADFNASGLNITLLEYESRRFIMADQEGAFPPGTWEAVGSFGASQAGEYVFRASTLADMVGTTVHYSVYIVTARTEDPSVWFVSVPDSGVSIDNLAPEPPLSVAGEQSYAPGGLQITWDPNSEDDLWYYSVYRGNGGTPALTMAELVATPQTSEYFDDSWSWDEEYWYMVIAVDIHENESDFTLLTGQQVTGDDPPQLPNVTFLAQNHPNPFNPITTIAFGLKEQGQVSLRIYDAAGKIITELIDESRPAGRYRATWYGMAENGTPVASGVYFCRLTTDDFVQTKKMVLLR